MAFTDRDRCISVQVWLLNRLCAASLSAEANSASYQLLTMQADGHWQVCSLGDEAAEFGPNGAYESAPDW